MGRGMARLYCQGGPVAAQQLVQCRRVGVVHILQAATQLVVDPEILGVSAACMPQQLRRLGPLPVSHQGSRQQQRANGRQGVAPSLLGQPLLGRCVAPGLCRPEAPPPIVIIHRVSQLPKTWYPRPFAVTERPDIQGQNQSLPHGWPLLLDRRRHYAKLQAEHIQAVCPKGVCVCLGCRFVVKVAPPPIREERACPVKFG